MFKKKSNYDGFKSSEALLVVSYTSKVCVCVRLQDTEQHT